MAGSNQAACWPLARRFSSLGGGGADADADAVVVATRESGLCRRTFILQLFVRPPNTCKRLHHSNLKI